MARIAEPQKAGSFAPSHVYRSKPSTDTLAPASLSTMRPSLRWRLSRTRRRLVQAACSTLYQDRNPDVRRSIMVAGTARSGTTWLADLLASQMPCRLMFEPFHNHKVPAFQPFHYFQYMRPSDENHTLETYCAKVFTGRIRNGWIDRKVECVFPQYRIIKEIRANLFLRWMHDRFPTVPLLFIVRHPCAVVLSRLQLGWATDSDIQPFLFQPKLIEDFLSDKMSIIDRARTPEEKHAVIWCISNLVPLQQFRSNLLHVLFYEDLCTQPEITVPKIFQAVGHPFHGSVLDRIGQPSITSVRTSAIVTGQSMISHWKENLSTNQIDSILSVVKEFELDYLYGDSLSPLVQPEKLHATLHR